MNEPVIDAQRQQKAKQYALINRRLLVINLVIGGVYILLWLLSGWAEALRNFLEILTTNSWLLVAGFIAVYGGIFFLIDLPLSFYSDFILPHQFDLSTQTLKSWISDQLKGLLIGVPLGLALVEIIYWVLRIAPNTWWVWAWAIIFIFNVLLANLAPILIAPLFYKFEPLKDSNVELEERLLQLAEKAHVQVKGVFKFDMSRRTKAANAALFGLGNTRRIILGDTLLSEFSNDEIETVLAHELGHHVHKDIPVGILVGGLTNLIGLFFAYLGLRAGVHLMGLSGPSDVAGMPLVTLIMGLFGLITMPLENAYSRWREKLADEYALVSTHKPEAFANAMTRLANQNLAEVNPEPWVEFLLYSHPALNKRIEMAKAYEETVRQIN